MPHGLGDPVFLDLPGVGKHLDRGEVGPVIEGPRGILEVAMPVGGVVVATNWVADEDPGVVGREPLDGGWLLAVLLARPDELDLLMDLDAYRSFVRRAVDTAERGAE